MEFTELLSAYTNIGVLGLIAVMFIYMIYQSYKNKQDINNMKTTIENQGTQNIQEQQQQLVNEIREQNKIYTQNQSEYFELLINKIISGVTNHVPSAEETEKITKASIEIDNVLQHMLIKTNADRACLVQYHNGGKGVNHQSFLKMSMTNEKVKLDVKPMIGVFKDQFRSMVAYLVHSVNDMGILAIDDIERLKDVDSTTYEFLKYYDINACYGIRIRDNQGHAIGFLGVLYIDKYNANTELVTRELENQQSTIESLLRV